VFGRGTFGGGGYNVPKALRAIQDASLSTGMLFCFFCLYSQQLALFAPGWVFEEHGSADFEANQVSTLTLFQSRSYNWL
jgi:hypothetical protein